MTPNATPNESGSPALKACPFCGCHKASLISGGISDLWICCDKCHSEGPMGRGAKRAIAAWNRRAPTTTNETGG